MRRLPSSPSKQPGEVPPFGTAITTDGEMANVINSVIEEVSFNFVDVFGWCALRLVLVLDSVGEYIVTSP